MYEPIQSISYLKTNLNIQFGTSEADIMIYYCHFQSFSNQEQFKKNSKKYII